MPRAILSSLEARLAHLPLLGLGLPDRLMRNVLPGRVLLVPLEDVLDRLLDPGNPSLTVASLGKAAAALGLKVDLKLEPA